MKSYPLQCRLPHRLTAESPPGGGFSFVPMHAFSLMAWLYMQGRVSPSRATKGLSDRPLETFGFPPDGGAFSLFVGKTVFPCRLLKKVVGVRPKGPRDRSESPLVVEEKLRDGYRIRFGAIFLLWRINVHRHKKGQGMLPCQGVPPPRPPFTWKPSSCGIQEESCQIFHELCKLVYKNVESARKSA